MLYPSPNAAGRGARAALLAAALCLALRVPAPAQTPPGPADPLVRLPGPRAPAAAQARALDRLAPQEPVALAFALPLRDRSGAEALTRRLQDPHDPLYGRYLTPQEFTDRFGPTAQDYAAVADYARALGLTVTGAHAGRLLLDVAGPAAAVEAAFGVRLRRYQGADGRVFRAPDAAPAVPASVAARVSGVVGLDTSAVRRPHLRRLPADLLPLSGSIAPIPGAGTGPNGGLSPSDIKSAYGLNGVTLDGSGQALAVFELDGYAPGDIRTYETTFGLPQVVLQNVLVDGASGQDTGGGDEVTLDIEMANALAPRVSRILVYEGPNTNQGILDTYARIADDDQAQSVSTSWGLDERQSAAQSPDVLPPENDIFTKMAAQGQTIFAAGGDNGAYDDGSALSVDDPASQPYVTGVGGTSLRTASAGGVWSAEGVWDSGSLSGGAGGGGVSSYWPLPAYQSGAASAASQGSATMRNVPDVALNADPQAGYSIYYHGGWVVYGGTSCAAPLWAGFTALVNQQRAQTGQAAVGQINVPLYQIGTGQLGSYAADFHDISGGTTRYPLFYPAVAGYDLATGWGSFRGLGLLAALSGTTAPSPATAFPLPGGLSLFSLPYTGAVPGLVGVTTYLYNGSAASPYTQSQTGVVQRGVGYWARLPSGATLGGQPSGTDNSQPSSVGLSARWNQVGDPFALPVALANTQVVQNGTTYSFLGAQAAGLISGTLYRYDNATNSYVPLADGAALTPGQGLWLYAFSAATLQVPPP